MTVNESAQAKLRDLIGAQALTIISQSAELEALRIELAKLKLRESDSATLMKERVNGAVHTPAAS